MPDPPPIRACGSNVILRRVKMDTSFLFIEGRDDRVLQIMEVVSVGPRWLECRMWSPPVPGATTKPVVYSEHRDSPSEAIKPGDLVVVNQARVYDHFTWDGIDYLIYPGDWIHGIATETDLDDQAIRRYDKQPI